MLCARCENLRREERGMILTGWRAPSQEHRGKWSEIHGYECPACGHRVMVSEDAILSEATRIDLGLPDLSFRVTE